MIEAKDEEIKVSRHDTDFLTYNVIKVNKYSFHV